MAIIRSNILSEIRGSINGTTFSRNRYGAYARNRTVPVNPNTVAQQNARAALANSSIAWKGLTDPQKATWTGYAALTPVVNRLGESITLSAIAWWNKINGHRRFIGLAEQTTAPPEPGQAEVIAVTGISIHDSASADPNTVSVNGYEMGETAANARYSAWISVGPTSLGVTYYAGPWIYLGSLSGTNRTDEYPEVPYAIVEGAQYFIKLRYMDQSGRLSPDHIEPILAQTAP